MYRLTQEDLADVDQSMAMNFKPISKMELPKIVKGLAYLDLAAEFTYPIPSKSKKLANADRLLSVLVSAGVDLSTGPDLSTGKYIVIPTGAVKLLNRSILKLQGNTGEFLLFPNLPTEVRAQILECTLPERLIVAVEQFNRLDQSITYSTFGGHYPAVCIASKSMQQDLIEMGLYRPAFQLKHNKKAVMFNGKTDRLIIDSRVYHQSEGAIVKPKNVFSDVLVNVGHLDSVSKLGMEFSAFINCLPWVKKNIASLPSLKQLVLMAKFSGATGPDVEIQEMVFRKDAKTKVYEPLFIQGNTTSYCELACEEFCDRLPPFWIDLMQKFLDHLADFPEDGGLPNAIIFRAAFCPFSIDEYMDFLQD